MAGEAAPRATRLVVGPWRNRYCYAIVIIVIIVTRLVVGPWRNRYCFKAFANSIQSFVREGMPP